MAGPVGTPARYHDAGIVRLAESQASRRLQQEAIVSVGQRRPAVLHASLQRLDELAKLEADWDTYGALPLTATALALADAVMRKAVKLLGATLGERVAPYTVMPI